MTGARLFGLALCVSFVAIPALADEDEDEDDTAGAPAAAKKDDDPSDLPVGDEDVETAPPLPPARATDQQPAPHDPRGNNEPDKPSRALALGVDLVLRALPTESDGVSYLAGLGYGAHARAELNSFLALRVYFTRAVLEVTTEEGALELPGTRVDQPAISLTTVAARLEPTWSATERVRLFLGPGVAWSRLVAPIPTTTGATTLFAAERSGVFVEWSVALGLIVDILPNRLAATVLGHGAILSNVSGSVFDSQTAIDQTGARRGIGGLPTPESTLGASFGLSAIF